MSIKLATFATPDMHRSAIACGDSALLHGASWFWEYDPHSPALAQFYIDHAEILSNQRGAGFWLWKPALVIDAMSHMKDGDILIYSDAGVEFINNVQIIIDRMDQDIFLFGNQWPHFAWCKRDIIDEVMPLDYVMKHWPEEYQKKGYALAVEKDRPAVHWDNFGKQVQASVIFFRVNDYTRAFVKEWLDWCLFEGGRLIDDSPSRSPNHPEFQENRHDQAILTTMAYRDGIKLHWWPAVYGPGRHPYPKNEFTDDYPPIFLHHRRRNHEWEQVA